MSHVSPFGTTWRERLSDLHPKRFFLRTWKELDADKDVPGKDGVATPYDKRPLWAFAIGAVCLTAMEYFGHANNYRDLLVWLGEPASGLPLGSFANGDLTNAAPHWTTTLRQSRWFELSEFAWWSSWRVLGYFVIPAMVIKFVFKERIKDHGLSTEGFWTHSWIYTLSFLFVLILVIGVSFEESFQTYYPFYRRANRSWLDFGLWEVLYAAQFFSLEFFFRGFWLQSCRKSMGSQAIFAMTVPYCMIHFGKPVMETLAAVIAGIVLGTLAMRTRSIWSGFLIHVSVAISMDLAALYQTSGWPTSWTPLP